MAYWSAAEVVNGTGDAAFAAYESGSVAGWNLAAQELLGYSSDEVLGTSIETLFSVHDDSWPQGQRANSSVSRFRANANRSDGRTLALGVSVVRLPRPAGTSSLLLHIMVPEAPDSGAPRPVIPPESPGPAGKATEVCLTPRETEILRLLADGKPAQATADHLIIGLTTVRTHIRNILQKLQVHSQLEAVALAFRMRLI